METKKISAALSDEIKVHIFIFALVAFALELLQIYLGDVWKISGNSFIFAVMGFFLFHCLLQYLFQLLIPKKVAIPVSLFPAILLFFILNNSEFISNLQIAIIVAAILRLLTQVIPNFQKIISIISAVLVISATALFLSNGIFKDVTLIHSLMFTFLVTLTINGFQKTGFPFYYFALLALILCLLPIRSEPINWEPVAEKAAAFINNSTYFISNLFGTDKYETGYSSLDKSGGSLSLTDSTQLIITTDDKPYFIFFDEVTNKNMKQARTLYLTGTDVNDISKLIQFANLLYNNDVDKEQAAVFSRIAKLSEEYAYLNTEDEIAPINSFRLTDSSEVSLQDDGDNHKKGYSLNAYYLDIDYGSPYLMELYRKPVEAGADSQLSYQECCDYLSELYGINFSNLINQEAFDYSTDILDEGADEYLDTSGSSDRLADLASDITKDYLSDYDKCLAIESYLKQYTYSTELDSDAVVADMNEASGMSSLADYFLFDSGSGYCVHYTSSMVMLLRLSEIPARPVSGYHYVFPLDSQTSYNVPAACSHTWPEAYIENVGWVPFEPTSPYISAQYRSWRKQLEDEGQSAESLTIPTLPDSVTEDTNEDETISVFTAASTIGLIIICLVLLLLIIIFGSKALQLLRYFRGDSKQKLEMDVDLIKKAIKKQSKDEFEDRGFLSDYVEKAPSYLKDDAKNVFDLYYKVVYGNEDYQITPKESLFAKELRESLYKKYI